MAGRRGARRSALELLYQWDLTGQPLGSLFEGDPDPFALETAQAVAERASFLDERISASADEWRAERLGVLERNILRMGIYELQQRSVPQEVAISEAVELAKRYTSDEGARLVNGILGRVAREEAERGRG